jgi:hypothetical protein
MKYPSFTQNITRLVAILLPFVLLSACSDDPVTVVTSPESPDQAADEIGDVVTLNNMVLNGMDSWVDESLIHEKLSQQGLTEGWRSNGFGDSFIAVAHGVADVTADEAAQLSQCQATSGLFAFQKFVEFSESDVSFKQQMKGATPENLVNRGEQESVSIAATASWAFLTDFGPISAEFQSHKSSIRTMETLPNGEIAERERFENRVEMSTQENHCRVLEDDATETWACDVEKFSQISSSSQRRSDEYLVMRWLFSEIDRGRCVSAFALLLPSRTD